MLPGPVESGLIPLAEATAADSLSGGSGLAFPGWWLFVLAGLLVLLGEWYLFNRRITD
jgi:hypothetical protein